MNNNLHADIATALSKISPYIRCTPLIKSITLSERFDANVYFKCENLQLTGSFKARGAFNKLLSLNETEKKRGIVAASSGNHGAGVAYAGKQLGVETLIFVPNNASRVKVKAIESFGGVVKYFGDDCGDAEQHARLYAQQHDLTFVSPYNDYDVICGQGTIACELERQLPSFDEIYVSVGGGGLISGIGGYLKHANHSAKVVGCLPLASPCMYECIKAGKVIQVDSTDTLSDGTAGNVEEGAITFDYCRDYVDDFSLVSEAQIAEALRGGLLDEHLLLEGAAGVAIAGLMQNSKSLQGKNIVVLLCGANISLEVLKSLL